MSDLFDHSLKQSLKTEAPLAARMRPRTLDEFVGQEEILGEGKLLRRAIQADKLFSSIILWGPPGTGKTTLAMVIANHTQSHFETLSAVLDGVARLREVEEIPPVDSATIAAEHRGVTQFTARVNVRGHLKQPGDVFSIVLRIETRVRGQHLREMSERVWREL